MDGVVKNKERFIKNHLIFIRIKKFYFELNGIQLTLS